MGNTGTKEVEKEPLVEGIGSFKDAQLLDVWPMVEDWVGLEEKVVVKTDVLIKRSHKVSFLAQRDETHTEEYSKMFERDILQAICANHGCSSTVNIDFDPEGYLVFEIEYIAKHDEDFGLHTTNLYVLVREKATTADDTIDADWDEAVETLAEERRRRRI